MLERIKLLIELFLRTETLSEHCMKGYFNYYREIPRLTKIKNKKHFVLYYNIYKGRMSYNENNNT